MEKHSGHLAEMLAAAAMLAGAKIYTDKKEQERKRQMKKNQLRILGLLGTGAALAAGLIYANQKRKAVPSTTMDPEAYVEHRKEEQQPEAASHAQSTSQDTTEEIQEKAE